MIFEDGYSSGSASEGADDRELPEQDNLTEKSSFIEEKDSRLSTHGKFVIRSNLQDKKEALLWKKEYSARTSTGWIEVEELKDLQK